MSFDGFWLCKVQGALKVANTEFDFATDEESDDPYATLPEGVVKSVMERWGYPDSEASAEPEPELEPTEPSPEPEPEPVEPAPTPDTEPVPEQGYITPPGGPVWAEDQEQVEYVTLPDGRQIPAAVVAMWADEVVKPSQRQPTSAPPTVPQQPQPAPVALPPLPQVTAEDLEMAGPAVQALLIIANQQAQQIRQFQDSLSTYESQVQDRAYRENAEIANSAATNFQRTYNLPDEIMGAVVRNTQQTDMAWYADQHRNDPKGPDPYKAVEHALDRAYWNTPEARVFEFERQASQRGQAQVRKQKLAGIGGSSGSGPARNQPVYDESTPEGRHAAAVEVARQAMYGDE